MSAPWRVPRLSAAQQSKDLMSQPVLQRIERCADWRWIGGRAIMHPQSSGGSCGSRSRYDAAGIRKTDACYGYRLIKRAEMLLDDARRLLYI